MTLKPCPFCGGKASFGDDGNGGVFIQCETLACQASTCLMYPEKCDVHPLLAEKWNQRAHGANGQ